MQMFRSQVERTDRELKALHIEHLVAHGRVEDGNRKELVALLLLLLSRIRKRLKRHGPDAPVEVLMPDEDDSQDFERRQSPWWLLALLLGWGREHNLVVSVIGGDEMPEPASPRAAKTLLRTLGNLEREALRQWMRARMAIVWPALQRGLRKRIEKILLDGLEAGDSSDAIAERLQREIEKAIPGLAGRSGRTEATGGMNAGGQFVREKLGITQKQWLATLDGHTRTGAFDHVAPHGQLRPNGDPFAVSGEALMYPGDGSRGASLGNLINCRCLSVASKQAIIDLR